MQSAREELLLRRQRILADFGDYALQSDNLDDVLHEACELVGKAMETGRAKVLEIEADAQTLFVRAGVGWAGDVVGQTRISMLEHSSESYSIKARKPVISCDIQQEARFSVPRFMKDAGVRSLANVPIFLPGNRTFGLLQVDATEPRNFDQDDSEFLRTYAAILGPVIDRLLNLTALRVAEDRFRMTVEAARDYAIFITDKDNLITDWLPGAANIYGWRAEEILGRHASIIFTPEDCAAGEDVRELREAYSTGMAPNVRWHMRKGGSRVFIEGSVRALKDSSGSITGFIKIGQDVTERRETTARLRKTGERRRFFLELSDALRPVLRSEEISLTATEHLARHLQARRVSYGMDVGDGEHFEVTHNGIGDGVSSVTRYRYADVAPGLLRRLQAGEVIGEAAAQEEGATADGNFTDFGLGGSHCVPLVKDGAMMAWIGVEGIGPDRSTPEDIDLLKEVAERVWAAVGRANSQTALRRSEEKYRTLFHSMDEAYAVVEVLKDDTGAWADFRFLEVNPAFLEHTSMVDPVGKTATELLGAPNPRWAQIYGQALDRGEPLRFEETEQTLNRIFDLNVFSLDPEHNRVAVLFTNITERRRSEAALRESEERLNSAIEIGKLGLWDWNVVTGEIHWSDEHFRMEGYEVGEVTPSYENWASRMHPEDRAPTEEALSQAMRQREEYVREFRVIHPTGAVRWLHARGRFFYGPDGKPQRMIGAMIDTTDRREWEERQQVLIGELQHRTRNLMAVVRSISDRTSRSSRDLADFRQRFADRLNALSRVQGLLSKLKDRDRVTFDELIRAELSAMGVGAERSAINGPPGIRLRSSTVQTLALALHELATNAVKYGALGQSSGHLAVTWSFEPAVSGNDPWLHIDWRETGVKVQPSGPGPFGTGQGRELIEQALPYQLGAKVTYVFEPDGLHCTISLPVSASLTRETGNV